MPKFVIERQYLVPMYQHIVVEAETFEAACELAVTDDIAWDSQKMDCDNAHKTTITEAKAYSIMCAYNAVDKYPACANKMLLETILRGDWNFQGFVTSDCGAVDDFFEAKAHHTSPDKDAAAVAGIEAGTDTNCGRTYLALTDAVKKGLITEAQLDVSLKRLYLARFKLGLFDPPEKMLWSKVPFSEVGSPAHAALALTAAREPRAASSAMLRPTAQACGGKMTLCSSSRNAWLSSRCGASAARKY